MKNQVEKRGLGPVPSLRRPETVPVPPRGFRGWAFCRSDSRVDSWPQLSCVCGSWIRSVGIACHEWSYSAAAPRTARLSSSSPIAATSRPGDGAAGEEPTDSRNGGSRPASALCRGHLSPIWGWEAGDGNYHSWFWVMSVGLRGAAPAPDRGLHVLPRWPPTSGSRVSAAHLGPRLGAGGCAPRCGEAARLVGTEQS